MKMTILEHVEATLLLNEGIDREKNQLLFPFNYYGK